MGSRSNGSIDRNRKTRIIVVASYSVYSCRRVDSNRLLCDFHMLDQDVAFDGTDHWAFLSLVARIGTPKEGQINVSNEIIKGK